MRRIEETCLDSVSYLKTIRRYIGKLRHPMIISFDNRLRKLYGDYFFDGTTHIIRISPWTNKNDSRHSELRNLIQTTLHEIHHFHQWKKLKSSFWSKKYLSDDSPLETDARKYEEKYIDDAISFYKECRKKRK